MLQVSLCLGSSLAVGQKLYAVLSVFTIVAESNGVNLTDGLDGLAAGTCALALTGMAVVLAPTCYPLAVFSCALAGAACGFLAYNHHVASCFMGDTGSLAFGGALGILAVLSGRFGQLLLVSGVFAAECLSVLLQVRSGILQWQVGTQVFVWSMIQAARQVEPQAHVVLIVLP